MCCQEGSTVASCVAQAKQEYCATAAAVSNPILQQWTCPSSIKNSDVGTRCPATMEQIKVNIDTLEQFKLSHDFTSKSLIIPGSTFEDFNCKFHVQVDQKLLDAQQKAEGYLGYIMVEVETYGFDESVHVMVQP